MFGHRASKYGVVHIYAVVVDLFDSSSGLLEPQHFVNLHHSSVHAIESDSHGPQEMIGKVDVALGDWRHCVSFADSASAIHVESADDYSHF